MLVHDCIDGGRVHRWRVPHGHEYHGRTDVAVDVRETWDGDEWLWTWTVSVDGLVRDNEAREERDAIARAFEALWLVVHG